MGCAPSQREIIQQLAKNTLRPLKKARALGSADKTPTESLTHSISGGLGNSDSESSLSEDVQQNASGPGNKEERRRAGRGHGQHPPPSTVPACTPELYNKERKKEKLTAGDRTVRSEVVASQKYVPRDMPVHKHQMYSDWHDDAAQQPRRTRKQKGSHATKQTKSAKLRARSHSGGEEEEKVDFPTSLVKAHHAAYAYLNPSLSKYDAILTLTDQAAQTQLMLQQMVSFLILRFEEVNQILEDIATEGERLVKDVGPHLAWPIEKGAGEDRPDLLQQLLQYTVNKMQATNGTVTALAATALQEARGHLQSAADALQQGLAAKQQVDQRLRRMIGQLEGCVWQQPGTRPGDTALYSEDSGIGADTDSLKESCNPEQCGRRASGDPGWHLSGRAALPRTSQRPAKFGTPEPGDGARDCRFGGRPARASRWPSLQDGSEGSFESGGSMEGEALSLGGSLDFGSAGEDEDDDGGSSPAPQRPSSSPPESGARRPASPASEAMANRIKDAISHRIRFVPSAPGSAAWSDEEGSRPPARPSSAHGGPGPSPAAERPGRSRSTESLKSRAEDPTLLELQRTGRELSRRLDKMRRAKEGERRRGGGGGRRGDPPEQAEVEVARPKLPAPPPTSPAPNRLKASLRKDFSVLPSQGPGSLRRPPGQGRQAEAEAAPFKRVSPQAKESQAPQAGPQRKSVRGLIDSFSRGRGGGGEAGDDGGGGGPLAALDGTRPSLPSAPATLPRPGRTTQRPEAATFPPPPPPAPFPPPPAALELPLDGLTAAAAPMDTCAGAAARVAGNAWAVEGARAAGDACAAAGAGARVAGDACAAAAGSGARAAGDACAVRVAAPAVSRATATQRLLASLDSVALLPSRQPPGGGLGAGARLRRAAEPAAVAPWSGGAKSQEHGAESLRRLKAAAGAGEQWQPYKIINLRYAGASCGSPESGAAPPDPPASPLRTAASPPGERRVHSVPREEGAGDDGRAARSPPAPRRCQPAAARKTSATKPTALSPSVGRKPASPPWHLSPATVHPAPPGPADQSRFPSPALQPNHLFRPIGYAAARRGPEPVWEPGHLPRASASAQPSLRRQLSPRTLPSPPPQASKLSSPPPQASTLPSPPPQASTLPSPPPQASKLPSPPPQASKLPSPPPQASKLPSPPPQASTLPSPPPQASKLPSPPPQASKLSSPPHQASKLSSPPHQAWKLPSPPPQARKLPSPPPQARKLPSPPPQARKLPSPPPQARKLPSPPPPHASGASGHRDHLEADPMSPWPGKIASNASSIFCPSSDSLFEARQPPSPPANHIILGDASLMTSRAAWRNNFMLRQPGDRQRRLTLSGVHPQPFVKRNYLPDCRTGAQTGLPAPGSAGSEPTLHSVGLNSENEGDPWTRHCISNLRGSSRSVSHPELCIIGQGLQ